MNWRRFLASSGMLKVAVIAPASPCEEGFSEFKNYLAKYQIELIDFCNQEPAKALENAFKDENIDAILAYRGGFGCCKMVDHVNWQDLKTISKPFLGYSDISILLNRINKELDIPTFHAPVLKQVKELSSEDLDAFILALRGIATVRIEATSNLNKSVKGQIIGGNLTILASVTGTDDQISAKDKILFLEDVNEKLYRIERSLWQLKRSGQFSGIKAILLGEFLEEEVFSEEFQLDVFNLFKKELPGCLIINRVKAGHGPRNATIPFGKEVEVVY